MKKLLINLFSLVSILVLLVVPQVAADITQNDVECAQTDLSGQGNTGGTCFYQLCSSTGDGTTTGDVNTSGSAGNGVSFDDSQSSDTGGHTNYDTDGTGSTSVGRGSTSTSLSNNGAGINGDAINYIALNPGWAQAHGIKIGDVAAVTYKGKTIYAIYGDNHVGNTPHAEISVRADLALKGAQPPDNLSGVHFTIYPNTRSQLGISGDSVSTNGSFDQSKIDQIGAQVSGGASSTAPSTVPSAGGCCTVSSPTTAEGLAAVDLKSIASKYNLQSAEVQQLGGSVMDSYMADSPPNTPASVLKLVIADAYLSTNPDLNKMLTIHANQLYGAGRVGETRKASDVLTGMLSISDNTDANLLIDAVGGFGAITHIAQGLGYTHTEIKNYYQASGGNNTTTASDISKAMNKVYTATGPGYSIAQDALRTAATGPDNFYGVNDEANKWAGTQGTSGTPPVAGNSGVFKISDQKYIITLYINEPDTVGGKPNPKVAAASADIANQIQGSNSSTGSTVSQPSASCCPSSSSGSSGPQLTGSGHVAQAYNFFVKQGLTPFQAAVIVGTMMEESGHSLNPTDVNPSSGAYGIAQWLGGRLTSLESFAQSQSPPTDKSDFATQLGYVWHELGGSYKSTLDKLKGETDIDTAVYDFEATYEVSGHQLIPERQADAKKVLHDLGGGAGGGGGGGSTGSDSCPGSGSSSGVDGYQNPLRDVKNLTPSRIDQGVDYTGSGPVYAMGDGKVLNVTNTGWYGVGKVDAFIVYRLSGGPAAGKFVYFAENCAPKVNIGDKVYAGDSTHPPTVICNMLPDNSPTDPESIETGWADGTRIGDALAHDVWVGHDSTAYYTDAGKNYSDLLVKLTAPPGTIKSGATELKAPLPSGWPTW